MKCSKVYELFAVSIDWEAAYASTYSVQLRSNEAEPWYTAAWPNWLTDNESISEISMYLLNESMSLALAGDAKTSAPHPWVPHFFA